jgi:hypothetical protein
MDSLTAALRATHHFDSPDGQSTSPLLDNLRLQENLSLSLFEQKIRGSRT